MGGFFSRIWKTSEDSNDIESGFIHINNDENHEVNLQMIQQRHAR